MKLLRKREAQELLAELDGWEIHGKVLAKEYRFKEFMDGLGFVERVATIAERQDHHPDVLLSYGRVVLEITTHSTGRLTDKDFKLATAIDNLSE
jgi:4a-hydroxytetrahydrobiopterin dehydratase